MKNILKITVLSSSLLFINSAFACNQYCESVIAGKMATIASLTATYKAAMAAQKAGPLQGAYTPVSLGNNPFLFCKSGEFINELGDQGWAKISSATGSWTITNRDVFAGPGNPQDVAKYVALCPYGGPTGF